MTFICLPQEKEDRGTSKVPAAARGTAARSQHHLRRWQRFASRGVHRPGFPTWALAERRRGSEEAAAGWKKRAGSPRRREDAGGGPAHLQAQRARGQAGLPAAVPQQGIASAPAQAAARRAVPHPEGGMGRLPPPGSPRAGSAPAPPRPQPRSHRGSRAGVRGARAVASPGLTWGCTSPRPPAAARSPSRAAPAPRRPTPPLPPPPPRPPARRHRAAAGWRRGSRGRTPGK